MVPCRSTSGHRSARYLPQEFAPAAAVRARSSPIRAASAAAAKRCRTTNDIELKIPAGIDNGQVLRVGGQGDAGLNGGPSGDLNVSVNVRPHDLFTRRGVDIYCEIPITYAQAVLGDKVTVPTIKGKVEYDIPEGTQSGTKFRLRGEGVKYLGRESYGDQYVTVVVEVPRKLTRQQKELLQKFDDSLEEKIRRSGRVSLKS